MKPKMLIITIIFLLFCVLFFPGCFGITPVPLDIAADSTAVHKLVVPKDFRAAVVIRLTGKITTKWVDIVQPYFADDQYSMIILWIESGGGSITDAKLLAHKFQMLKQKHNKNVYVFTERFLASGAYWVACIADEIIAAPAAYVGSIGVYMIRVDARQWYQELGVQLHYIVSDSAKIRGNSASKLTEEELKYWQASIDAIYEEFIGHVWTYRQRQFLLSYMILNQIDQTSLMSTTQVRVNAYEQFRKIARGDIYTGYRSFAYGLIDRCIYFDQFVKLLGKWQYVVYNTEGEEIEDLYIEKKSNPSKNSKDQK